MEVLRVATTSDLSETILSTIRESKSHLCSLKEISKLIAAKYTLAVDEDVDLLEKVGRHCSELVACGQLFKRGSVYRISFGQKVSSVTREKSQLDKSDVCEEQVCSLCKENRADGAPNTKTREDLSCTCRSGQTKTSVEAIQSIAATVNELAGNRLVGVFSNVSTSSPQASVVVQNLRIVNDVFESAKTLVGDSRYSPRGRCKSPRDSPLDQRKSPRVASQLISRTEKASKNERCGKRRKSAMLLLDVSGVSTSESISMFDLGNTSLESDKMISTMNNSERKRKRPYNSLVDGMTIYFKTNEGRLRKRDNRFVELAPEKVSTPNSSKQTFASCLNSDLDKSDVDKRETPNVESMNQERKYSNDSHSDSDDLRRNLVVKVVKIDSVAASVEIPRKDSANFGSKTSENQQQGTPAEQLKLVKRKLRRKTPLRLAAERRFKYLKLKCQNKTQNKMPSELSCQISTVEGNASNSASGEKLSAINNSMLNRSIVDEAIANDCAQNEQLSDNEVSFSRKTPCAIEQSHNSLIVDTISVKKLSARRQIRTKFNESARKRIFKHKNRRSQIKFLTDGMTQYFQSEEGKRPRSKRLREPAAAAPEKKMTESSDAGVWNQVRMLTKLSRGGGGSKLADQSRARHNRMRRIARKSKFSDLSSAKHLNELPPEQQCGDQVPVARQKTIQPKNNEDILFPHITDEDVRWFILAQSITRQRRVQSEVSGSDGSVALEESSSIVKHHLLNSFADEHCSVEKLNDTAHSEAPLNKSATKVFRMYCVENQEKAKSKVGWPKGRKRGPRPLRIAEGNGCELSVVIDRQDRLDVAQNGVISREYDFSASPSITKLLEQDNIVENHVLSESSLTKIQRKSKDKNIECTVSNEEDSTLKKIRRKSKIDLYTAHLSNSESSRNLNINEILKLRVSPRKKNNVCVELAVCKESEIIVGSAGNAGNDCITPVKRIRGRPKGSLSGPRKPKQIKEIVDGVPLNLSIDMSDNGDEFSKKIDQKLIQNKAYEMNNCKRKKINDMSSTSVDVNLGVSKAITEFDNKNINSQKLQGSNTFNFHEEHTGIKSSENQIVTFHEDAPTEEIHSTISLLSTYALHPLRGKLNAVTSPNDQMPMTKKLKKFKPKIKHAKDVSSNRVLTSIAGEHQMSEGVEKPKKRTVSRPQVISNQEQLVIAGELNTFHAGGVDQCKAQHVISTKNISTPLLADSQPDGLPRSTEDSLCLDLNANNAIASQEDDDDFFAFLNDIPVRKVKKTINRNNEPKVKVRRKPSAKLENPNTPSLDHLQIVRSHADLDTHKETNMDGESVLAGIPGRQIITTQADVTHLDSKSIDKKIDNSEIKRKPKKKKVPTATLR